MIERAERTSAPTISEKVRWRRRLELAEVLLEGHVRLLAVHVHGAGEQHDPALVPAPREDQTASVLIGIAPPEPQGAAVDIAGVYRLDGGRLTIAYRKGSARPEKFESTPGSGVTLLELQRTDPPKPPRGMGMGGIDRIVLTGAWLFSARKRRISAAGVEATRFLMDSYSR